MAKAYFYVDQYLAKAFLGAQIVGLGILVEGTDRNEGKAEGKMPFSTRPVLLRSSS